MKYSLELTEAEISAIKNAFTPSGYKLLVALPKVQDKIGGIFLPGDRTSDEETASVVAKVVAIGHSAYADNERFPNGAWCKAGDVILMPPYAGHRFKVVVSPGEPNPYREVRLINDDTVMGVVHNPDAVSRSYDH